MWFFFGWLGGIFRRFVWFVWFLFCYYLWGEEEGSFVAVGSIVEAV
jgi:hypothetical protein